MNRRSWGRVGVALLGALLSPTSRAAAQDVALPPDLQVGLITKILTFDRRVDRYGPELVLGVAYQPRNRESTRAHDEIMASVAAAGAVSVEGMPLRVVGVPLADDRLPGDLADRVDVLYLTPVRAVDPRALLDEARAMGILTITATSSVAAQGAAVGLLLRDARPHITIDLQAARLAGADLSSRLLRLAEVRQ
jgi:hypothetical protein